MNRQNLSSSQLIYKNIEKTIKRNKESQLFYKAFLKPMEIALKNSQTQFMTQNARSLPFGIKQVVRPTHGDNRYELVDFQSFDQHFKIPNQHISLENVQQSRCSNLISLMKSAIGIKVAICICMYSQDKSMLKRTLAGVSKNIEAFSQKGFDYNQIAVFVVMDGIEEMHESVDQFFSQLEKDHNIYLGNDVKPLSKQEMLNQEKEEQQQQEIENINPLIFDEDQIQDFKQARFTERKKDYKTNKEMITNILKLEKMKNLDYQSLDSITQKFFIEKARTQWKVDFAASDEDIKQLKEEVFLQYYGQNKQIYTSLARQALSESKKYCQQYIANRSNLALMSSFRVPISILGTNEQQSRQFQPNYQGLNQDNGQSSSTIHMNLFLVTKYKNKGKLSSHNWFLNGFCTQLNPEYAILLDVGLVPDDNAILKMCQYMDINKQTGGVCGYMGMRMQKLGDNQQVKDEAIDCVTALSLRIFDIQRAQQFQYHFAHLIDKPFESSSCFKFIHVLPGAFSGYRMKALRPQTQAQPKILQDYFKSIDSSIQSLSYEDQHFSLCKTISKVLLPDFIFYRVYGKPAENSYEKLLYDENIYLAEDRTLCMGIHENGYQLRYLPDAQAWVDPMKTLYAILGQRKRWINGSYFAFEKVKQTLDSYSGQHCLKLQIAYLTFMNWLLFVAPALFFYTVHIAMYTFQTNVIIVILQAFSLIDNSSVTRNQVVGIFVYLIDFIYVLIFLGLVFYSIHLTSKQNRFKTFFYGVSTIYGIFSISVFGVLLYDIISGFSQSKNEFLINNASFINSLPGGFDMINSLRFIMLATVALYSIPTIIFSLTFKKITHIFDILMSSLSFIFYSPTYLNIFNIYALCRMDDISWGTKGLDTDTTNRKEEVKNQWKKIKIMHVSKFVIYNIVIGFLLILFGDAYVVRFWLTFGVMVVLFITLAIKVFFGVTYLIGYRCSSPKNAQLNQSTIINDSIKSKFNKVKKSMYLQIQKSLCNLPKDTMLSVSQTLRISNIYKRLDPQAPKAPRFKKQNMNFLNVSQINNKSRIQASKIMNNVKKVKKMEPIPGRQLYHNKSTQRFLDDKNQQKTIQNKSIVQENDKQVIVVVKKNSGQKIPKHKRKENGL